MYGSPGSLGGAGEQALLEALAPRITVGLRLTPLQSTNTHLVLCIAGGFPHPLHGILAACSRRCACTCFWMAAQVAAKHVGEAKSCGFPGLVALQGVIDCIKPDNLHRCVRGAGRGSGAAWARPGCGLQIGDPICADWGRPVPSSTSPRLRSAGSTGLEASVLTRHAQPCPQRAARVRAPSVLRHDVRPL